MTVTGSQPKFELVLHAPNVHTGGGRVLLLALLDALSTVDDVALTIDSRLKLELALNETWTVRRVAATLLDRLAAERSLVVLSKSARAVLCFGNLPPALSLHCPTTVFFQNRNLLDGADLSGFSWKARQRHAAERLWIRLLQSHASRFVVQSASMVASFKKTFEPSRPIEIWPLLPPDILAKLQRRQATPASGTRDFDFVYVSSGEPHKNHKALIEAWGLLAASGKLPTLALTLDEVAFALYKEVIAAQGLRVVNFPGLDRAGVERLLDRSACLVYPSLSESFGLPLLEAAAAGIAILAADLPYVDEVVHASARFDARSARAIAAAVEDFLARGPSAAASVKPGLIGPVEFLQRIIGEQELKGVDTESSA